VDDVRAVPVVVTGVFVTLESERVVARMFVVMPDRAVDAFGRATTRRAFGYDMVAVRARTLRVWGADGADIRALVADAARAVGRGTTFRAGAMRVVRAIVSMGFDDCVVVTPGFSAVRI